MFYHAIRYKKVKEHIYYLKFKERISIKIHSVIKEYII